MKNVNTGYIYKTVRCKLFEIRRNDKMKKLPENRYNKVKNIFKKLSFNLAVRSIIDKNTRGQIYVDKTDEPETALIWNEMTELFVSGKISDEVIKKITNLINQKIIHEANERYIPGFNIYYPSIEWKNKLDNIFIKNKVRKIKREYYEFNNEIYDWEKRKDDNLDLREINCDLLNSNYKNIEKLNGWVKSFWINGKAFEEKGTGYCLLKNDQIVSWCFSVYVKDKDYELAVATVKENQKKGYAKLVAARTVSRCIEENLNPQWHCNSQNTPSKKIAKDIGFKNIRDYEIAAIEL